MSFVIIFRYLTFLNILKLFSICSYIILFEQTQSDLLLEPLYKKFILIQILAALRFPVTVIRFCIIRAQLLRLEGLGQLKKSTSSRLEPASFRFVA
jgi:hypothetical protein